jgi:DNA polymerase I
MNILAFDTETKGFDWWAGETAFIATVADEHQDFCYNMSIESDVKAFIEHLQEGDVIVAHNLSFDVHQVRETTGYDLLNHTAVLRDTDLMSRVLWPEAEWGEHGGFGLEALTKVFLGREGKAGLASVEEMMKAIGVKKSDPGSYYDVWRAYPDVMETYARQDARDTWDLYSLMVREFNALKEAGDGRWKVYFEQESEVIPIVIRAEQFGVPVSQKAVGKLHAIYKQREQEQRESLEKQLGEQALGGKGSEEALVEALQKQGITLTETTDSGKLSTAKFALQKFADDFPVVDEFLEYRTTEKFLSTYIEPLQKAGDWIHPSVRQIGAWTGRMAYMRPNLQNIPVRSGPEVREVFEAPEGWALVCADFDSIEMRILAYYLGHEGQPYRDLINGGFDPHAHMASILWPEHPYEYYLKGQPGEDKRAIAKASLFAIIYGAGGRRLCDMNNLPTGPPLTANSWEVKKGISEPGKPSFAQGKALAKRIKANVPGYMKLMRRVRNKIEAHGYITTLDGRRNACTAEKSYVGMSALIQGSAAGVMKLALPGASRALEQYDGRIILIVHDEVVGLVPEQHAKDALAALQSAMETAVTLDPPLLTSGKIARNYGEAK